MMKVLIAVLVVLGIVALWLSGSYNGLVQANEGVKAQWSQVEVSYQRRFDLIPNLVNTTKGFAKQEKEVIGAIAEARTRYNGAGSINGKVQAANQFESALGRLMVVVENYPTLRSSDLFRSLMVELEGTENRISIERKRYNEFARDFNIKVRSFPTNIIAGFLGFKPAELFTVSTAEAKNAPKVDFEGSNEKAT
jgi:LemA protein